jgi:hypothetical protein
VKDGEGDARDVVPRPLELVAEEPGDAASGVGEGAAAEGAQDGVAPAGVA